MLMSCILLSPVKQIVCVCVCCVRLCVRVHVCIIMMKAVR